MAGRFTNSPVATSVKPLVSHTSRRPSLSVSRTVVLRMTAPHERQSKLVEPAWSTVVTADGELPMSPLTLNVGLSQAGPIAPVNGLVGAPGR